MTIIVSVAACPRQPRHAARRAVRSVGIGVAYWMFVPRIAASTFWTQLWAADFTCVQ